MSLKIGIDLLWVRHGIVGGTESYIRNLLGGLGEMTGGEHFWLFLARDNYDAFREYARFPQMHLYRCPVDCKNPAKRILWENLYLDALARDAGLDLMYIPVYSKPRTKASGIPYVVTIHDLQALHYPQYFSRAKRMYLKLAWEYSCKTAARVVTISDYCAEDLRKRYPGQREKITRIYDPVEPIGKVSSRETVSSVLDKYGVANQKYDYCVSSLLPHKNLRTILDALKLSERDGNAVPLVISGVGGRTEEFERMVGERRIRRLVICTGFVPDEERDALYAGCRLFLFPSVFEGFGLPPIEALMRGKRVVMTRESCLAEVTRGRAFYVEDPYDAEAWCRKMREALQSEEKVYPFAQYHPKCIAEEFLELFRSACREKEDA